MGVTALTDGGGRDVTIDLEYATHRLAVDFESQIDSRAPWCRSSGAGEGHRTPRHASARVANTQVNPPAMPNSPAPGPSAPGTSLVAVAVADHADDLAGVQRVPEQPLEDAPTRGDLDQPAEITIVVPRHVRVASADVRGQDHIVGTDVSVQAIEEQTGRVGWRPVVLRALRDLPMAGTEDRLTLGSVDHIAITTGKRVARPFVAGEDDESVVFVKLADRLLQLPPILDR